MAAPAHGHGRILSQSDAVAGRVPSPTEFSSGLIFDGGVSAEFYCSFLAAISNGFLSVAGMAGCGFPISSHPFNSREPAFEVKPDRISCPEAGADKGRHRFRSQPSWAMRPPKNTIMFRTCRRCSGN